MTEKYGRSFKGKVCSRAGGSRGMAKESWRRFGIRRRSSRIYLFQLGRKRKRLANEIEAAGGKAIPIRADSASADDIRAAVDQVVKELGELDVFVNNAGILIRGTIGSYSLEDLDRMLDINVRAAFVGIQATSEHMKDGGRIILIGSITAVRTAFPEASVYSMTKAALTGLVRGAAIDLAPRGNYRQQCPAGPTATDMSCATTPNWQRPWFRLGEWQMCQKLQVLSRISPPMRPGSSLGPASQSTADTSHN